MNNPELLAPASNLTAALTAFDAGADAVYVGLQRFNARERGENLTLDKFGRLVAYARRRNRRVYLTLNTLIKEQEIPDLVGMLADVARIRPHAVIVQDLAVVHIVREHFPELAVHASTQMGVHNSAGVRLLERLGVERVILERQTTMEEIREISANSNLELEVFVHGALCCCRSGSCLFSSWLGGWSGNRGKCKQPCRRRFYSEDGNGFFFSTNDLYSLDVIPQLKELGVASLKIEGRLRDAAYVRSVVKAYRMAIDAGKGEKVLGSAREVLTESLGRRWSRGFRSEDDLNDVIDHQRMGVSGLLIGDVQKTSKSGFEVRLSRPLSVGDRIRIQPTSGDEGPAITVTKLAIKGKPVTYAPRKRQCFIACDKDVPDRGRVFLTGHAAIDVSDRIDALPAPCPALDLDIAVKQNEIAVTVKNVAGKTWSATLDLAPAEKRPAEPDAVEKQFRSTGIETACCGNVEVQIDGDYFIPAKELKALRRSFWNWAESNAQPWLIDQLYSQRAEKCIAALSQPIPPPPNGHTSTTVLLKGGKSPLPKAVVAREFPNDGEELILPDFCSELELRALRKRLSGLTDDGLKRIRATSVHGVQLVHELGLDGKVEVAASFPLPAANSVAVRELLSLGVTKVMVWPELEEAAIREMAERSQGHVELLEYGRIPVLTTRAIVPASGRIRDDRGKTFTVQREHGHSVVYPDEVLALPRIDGVHRAIDLTHANLDEPHQSRFNFDRELA